MSTGNAGMPPRIKDMTLNEAIGSLSQYRGRVVVFHLYASWCGPCVKEFPDVNRLGRLYGPRGLSVLAISVDTEPRRLEQFLGNGQLSFDPIRVDASNVELTIAVDKIGGSYRGVIPYTAFFDQSGKLVKEWTGAHSYQMYESVIERFLPRKGTDGGFAIREHPSLKIANKSPQLIILTKDGHLSDKPTDEPLLIVGSTYLQSSIKDKRRFAEERLYTTGSISSIRIRGIHEIRISSLQGYEIVADARDTDLNAPIVLYQTILFENNYYYIIQGFSKPQEETHTLGVFREIATSFQRQ